MSRFFSSRGIAADPLGGLKGLVFGAPSLGSPIGFRIHAGPCAVVYERLQKIQVPIALTGTHRGMLPHVACYGAHASVAVFQRELLGRLISNLSLSRGHVPRPNPCT